MTLPAFWWLLLPVLMGHGLFFVAFGALRLKQKRLQDAPWVVVVFAASALCGVSYGIVQHDPVFVVAEILLTVIVYRHWRSR